MPSVWNDACSFQYLYLCKHKLTILSAIMSNMFSLTKSCTKCACKIDTVVVSCVCKQGAVKWIIVSKTIILLTIRYGHDGTTIKIICCLFMCFPSEAVPAWTVIQERLARFTFYRSRFWSEVQERNIVEWLELQVLHGHAVQTYSATRCCIGHVLRVRRFRRAMQTTW